MLNEKCEALRIIRRAIQPAVGSRDRRPLAPPPSLPGIVGEPYPYGTARRDLAVHPMMLDQCAKVAKALKLIRALQSAERNR